MLPVILFIAFWIVLAAIVFFVAGSGGARGVREVAAPGRRGANRAFGLAMLFVFVAFGAAIPALFLHGNHANASSQVGGITLNAQEKAGREMFAFRCGYCHELAASNSVGKVGPNLDTLKPPYQLVMSTIQNGCLQNPPTQNSPQACLGYGNMPAGVVGGQNARDVASFVARVAGRE